MRAKKGAIGSQVTGGGGGFRSGSNPVEAIEKKMSGQVGISKG